MNRAGKRCDKKLSKMNTNGAKVNSLLDPNDSKQTLTIDQSSSLASQHHRAGHLAEAEKIYLQVLKSDPNCIANALNVTCLPSLRVRENHLLIEMPDSKPN